MHIKRPTSLLFFVILLSFITSQKLDPISILEKSIHKFNNQDISFVCNLKLQSLSKEPINFNFNFYSHNLDSLKQYNYIKFNKPIDYNNVEVWSHYSNQFLMKKRMPINNEIIQIENDSQNINVVNFFNFIKLLEDVKYGKFSINETSLNNTEVYVIKSFNDGERKKSIMFYINKYNFSIYKIDWTNKRGALNKTLSFSDWIFIDNQNFPSKIIYEDIKKGSKSTLKLSNIKLKKLNQQIIDLIMIGFGTYD